MSEKEIIIKRDHEAVSTYTVYLIKNILEDLKKASNKKINIAFSGGDTPKLMFEKLANLTNIDWQQINIFLVDERYIEIDHKDSNYNLIKKHLLNHINIPRDNIHYVRYLDNIEESLKEYENQILDTFNLQDRREIPEFDLIHLGIGIDGHTASIFNPKKIDNKQILAITSGEKYERITFTYKILNNAQNILFLVTGKKKQEIVSKIIKNNKDYAAGGIDNKGNLYYLLDKEASLKL